MVPPASTAIERTKWRGMAVIPGTRIGQGLGLGALGGGGQLACGSAGSDSGDGGYANSVVTGNSFHFIAPARVSLHVQRMQCNETNPQGLSCEAGVPAAEPDQRL